MKSLMQTVLGDDWEALPAGLKAHHQAGACTDIGQMDIEYPKFMQPWLSLLRVMGVLINRRGNNIETRVEKNQQGNRQKWQRTIRFPEGKVVEFNSYWIAAANNQLIEFVNPFVGLKMSVAAKDGRLYFSGRNLVIKIGQFHISIPEWIFLGHTTIEEEAVDDTHFKMDFRLTHPLFGEVFRYAGEFESRKV